jgi:hypothetical protein
MLIKNSYLVGEVEIVSSLGEGNHDTTAERNMRFLACFVTLNNVGEFPWLPHED